MLPFSLKISHIYKIANFKRAYLLIASFLDISIFALFASFLMLLPTIPRLVGFSDIDFFLTPGARSMRLQPCYTLVSYSTCHKQGRMQGFPQGGARDICTGRAPTGGGLGDAEILVILNPC